ncbi:hypothetical protein [Streptomyces xinghaiensis]|uniref:hypothetical protein n=1 Tax=Streptomyces xinghaiensis TaxID=1038928 RepID=UPI003424A6F7
MRKPLITLAALALLAVPVHGTASAAPTGPTGPAAEHAPCYNWSVKSREGYANGRRCGSKVHGTVKDTRADGRCPYVRVKTQKGWYFDGPWVGPKGKSKKFTIDTRGDFATHYYLRYIHC